MFPINKKINDKFLVKYFHDHLGRVKFVFRPKNREKIKIILKKILNYEEKLKELTKKGIKLGLIPKAQQEKIKEIHKLWELLIKEAIYTLRKNDKDDPNEFKQDFGIIDIKKYFEEFSQFEDILYGSMKYYREHSLHVIRVFLLGFYLLNDSEINFKTIEFFPKDLKSEDENEDLEDEQAIWAIIALTHDLGYPIEKIENINNKIKKIIEYFGPSGIEEFKYYLPLQNQNLNNFILGFISSKIIPKNKNEYNTVIQNKYYLKFSKAFEEFSHGIMSCILLMKHLVYFKESDYSHSHLSTLNSRDAKQFQIRREILRAIASHDNQDIYYIDAKNFSFILAICDDIQEWDRPPFIQRFDDFREIRIIEFNTNIINYELLYPKNKDFRLDLDKIRYFAIKIKKYIKLFRSGPKSGERSFKFIYSLNWKEKVNPDWEFIKFIYPPNEKPRIISPILKNNIDYLDLFLDYIENEYEDNKKKDIFNLIELINEKIT